ncbi:MAG: hypothetical protein RSF42_19350 [Comamonas sp.]
MNSSQDPAQVGQATDRGLPAAAAPANPAEPSSSAPAHSQVLRSILSQRQLRDSIRLTSPPSLRITLVAAAQAALTVLLAMVVARLSPWPHLVGFASLGALAALFGRFAPLSQRKRIVLLSAGLLTVAVLVQSLVSLAGAAPWLMLLALALITGAATWAVSHWVLGAPGAVIVSFAAGAALAGGIRAVERLGQAVDLVLGRGGRSGLGNGCGRRYRLPGVLGDGLVTQRGLASAPIARARGDAYARRADYRRPHHSVRRAGGSYRLCSRLAAPGLGRDWCYGRDAGCASAHHHEPRAAAHGGHGGGGHVSGLGAVAAAGLLVGGGVDRAAPVRY